MFIREWLKDLWSKYLIEYYSGIRKYEAFNDDTWMECEVFMLTEMSENEKLYWMISLSVRCKETNQLPTPP